MNDLQYQATAFATLICGEMGFDSGTSVLINVREDVAKVTLYSPNGQYLLGELELLWDTERANKFLKVSKKVGAFVGINFGANSALMAGYRNHMRYTRAATRGAGK